VSSIKALQDSIKIICLGIDYRRYAKFRLLTPAVVVPPNTGEAYVSRHRGAPTAREYQFCESFVIECAIHLQSFTFEVDHGDPVHLNLVYRNDEPVNK